MNMDNEDQDFFKLYQIIQKRIKKRFLKKPKISDSSREFQLLAKKLNEQYVHDYSALTYLANARCENLLGNGPNESQALIESGRQYVNELITQADKGQILNKEELLASAINSYAHAIRVLTDKHSYLYAGNVIIEVANTLKFLGQTYEACTYFLRATEYFVNVPSLFLPTLIQLAYCLGDLGEYENSLMICEDIITYSEIYIDWLGSEVIGSLQDLLNEVYVNRTILFMIIRPIASNSRESIQFDHFSSLVPLNSHREFRHLKLNEPFNIALRSFVISWVEQDHETLEINHAMLIHFLTNRQQKLVQRVLETSLFQNI